MACARRGYALATIAAALFTMSALGCARQPSPDIARGPVSTTAQAAEWFYLDIARCLYSREHDGGVADLPPEAKADLRPATPSERFLFKDEATRVWTTDRYGSHVVLAELSPGKCQVVADRLPVETTFRSVLIRLHRADPVLREDPAKPGYWPIVHQLGRALGASWITVRLQGAEPGGLTHPLQMLMGHASSDSILIAEIERTPD